MWKNYDFLFNFINHMSAIFKILFYTKIRILVIKTTYNIEKLCNKDTNTNNTTHTFFDRLIYVLKLSVYNLYMNIH